MKNKETIKLTKVQTRIFLAKERFVVVNCGRRSGKSFVMREMVYDAVRELSLLALKEKKAGTSTPETLYPIYCLAPTLKQCRKLFFKPLLQILRKIDPNLYKNESEYLIRLSNNVILYFASEQNVDTERGDDAHYIFIDETRFFSKTTWEEALYPMLTRTKGKARFFSTPGGREGLHYELSIIQDPEYKQFNFTTLQAGLIPIEEIEKAKRRLDERSFMQEFEANFEAYASSVCYNYSKENHTTKEFDPTAKTYMCWDFNATEKPMACILVQEIEEKFYAVKEFVYKYTNTEAMCEIVLEYLQDVNFNGELILTGDSAGHQTRSSASRTDWQMIHRFFNVYTGGKKEMVRKTVDIKDRCSALNSYIRTLTGEIRFYVNPITCNALNTDLIRTEWAENGRDLNGNDPNRTHCLDAVSYLFYNLLKYLIKVEVY